jgi:hypothetical protein
MTNIFNLEKLEDFSEKIDIDDLYEKKKQHDLSQLALFNKILNRIHVRIKTTSRQKMNEQFCWYLIPEYIIGVPKYDQASCIAYIIDKLTSNGFLVKYIHPNTILISWKHWVPSYVRDEMKKKTGIVINEFGERVNTSQSEKDGDGIGVVSFSSKPQGIKNNFSYAYQEDPNALLFENDYTEQKQEKSKKNYKSTNSYKPSGKLIYNEDLFPQNIEDLS